MTQVKRAPRKDVFKYGVENIVLDSNFQYPRMEMKGIEELAESIRVNGVQEPLIGYKSPEDPTKVVVVHGLRRFYAYQIAVEKGMSEDVEQLALFQLRNPRGYTDTQKYIDIAIGNDSKELTGLEKGRIYTNLESNGMKRKEIAERLSVTQAHISDMISLTITPSPIQDAILNGMISSTLALQIVKENPTSEAQLEVFESAKQDMTETVSSTDEIKKTDSKITQKNVKSLRKSPIKTLEEVVNMENSGISESDLATISKVYGLLKKKVTVEDFIEAFK